MEATYLPCGSLGVESAHLLHRAVVVPASDDYKLLPRQRGGVVESFGRWVAFGLEGCPCESLCIIGVDLLVGPAPAPVAPVDVEFLELRDVCPRVTTTRSGLLREGRAGKPRVRVTEAWRATAHG